MRVATQVTSAELDLARQRLRFMDAAQAGTGDGLYGFDLELRYFYWSAGMERISGKSAAAVLGGKSADVFPFIKETGTERCLRDALQGKSSVLRDQAFWIRDTAREGFYDGFYAPLHADDGRIIGGTAIIRETTEKKQADQLLLETETRFRNMADASPVLLWMASTDALCTFFNQTWLKFTGRSLQQEWGVGWAEGVHYEDFQRCMDTYLAAFGRREVFEMEYRLRRADGEFRWILDRGTPRYTPDGTFAGYIGSCIDITERKEMEAALRKAVQNRDDFLSIASHELRTPLTSLQLQVEGMQKALSKPLDDQSRVDRIRRNVDGGMRQVHRLAQLVNELLDVSRIQGGKMVLEPEEFDLSALIEEVCVRFQAPLQETGASLSLDLDRPIVGTWDRSRLDRLITNLVGNAVKYGRGKPIEVSAHVNEGRVVAVVRDHGIGISKEDQARIFERFERAVSTRNFGGFGLGLWISREIANASGGTLSVESVLGEGAAFTVDLPLVVEVPAPPPARRSGSEKTVAPPH